MMKEKALCGAIASLLVCLLASGCGEQTPKSAGNAPKPTYEVPKDQLKQEADYAKKAAVRTANAQGDAASMPISGGKLSLDKGEGLGGTEKLGGASFGKNEKLGSASFGKNKDFLKDGGSSSSQAAAPAPTPAPASSTAAASSSNNAASGSAFPISAAAAGVADPGALDAVANYGTGATALTIKKNVENKLKNIQNKHNKDIEKASSGN